MREHYKNAGVDVEAGYRAVDGMRKHVLQTMRPEVIGGLGGFGGMFDLSSFNYKEPVLISGTDGVGTKLKLAFQMNKHDTIGVDAVAMCVNDIVAQGAEPLFFLDYIACGKNDPQQMEQVVKGIANGCEQSGCSLIGGETAEMPGMYQEGEYDLAGFVVGIAEKSTIITGENIESGDALIGIGSSGIHSNGYSLVRKLIDDQDLKLDQTYKPFHLPLGEMLLTPTKIYAKMMQQVQERVIIKGVSHVTGGGFYENLPRMLPENFGVTVKQGSWKVPDIFPFLQQLGSIPEKDMYGIFNMGIGMVLVVSGEDVDETIAVIEASGEQAWEIGSVTNKVGVVLT